MLNLVREGEEDYIEAIRYRRRLKSFENFLFFDGVTVKTDNRATSFFLNVFNPVYKTLFLAHKSFRYK